MKLWSYLYTAAIHAAYAPGTEPQTPTWQALLSDKPLVAGDEPFQGQAVCVIITQDRGNSAKEALDKLTANLTHIFRRQGGCADGEFTVPTTFFSGGRDWDDDEVPEEILSEFDQRCMIFKIDSGTVRYEIWGPMHG